MIAFARTLLFNLLFGLLSVVLVLLTALLAPLSRALLLWGARLWAIAFVWLARWLLGIRLVLRGRVPEAPVLVAAKHQSYYEAILILYLFRQPAVVMKAQLGQLPLWGMLARRYGSIFVAREKHGSALRAMLRQAMAHRDDGRPLFMFPEGTRTRPGDTPRLKSGLFALYRALEVPVAPVALDAGRCWPRTFTKHAGTITIAFAPLVPARLPRAEMEAQVHTAINADPRSCPVAE